MIKLYILIPVLLIGFFLLAQTPKKSKYNLNLASAMTEIQDSIANFTKLESLTVAQNKIQTISSEIAELQNQ